MLPVVVSAESVPGGAHGPGIHVFGLQTDSVDRFVSSSVSLALQVAGFAMPDEEIHVSVIGRLPQPQSASVDYAAWKTVPKPEDRNLEFPIVLAALAQAGQIPRGFVCGNELFVGPIGIEIYPYIRDGSYHCPAERYNEAHLLKPYGCEAIFAALKGGEEVIHSADDLGGHGCLLSSAIASIPGYAESLADEWIARESLKSDRHDVRHLFQCGGSGEFIDVLEEKRMFAGQFLDDPSWIDDLHPAEIDLGCMFDEWVDEHERDGIFVAVECDRTPARMADRARAAARQGEAAAERPQGISR